jgi:hypothetical protein
MGITNESAARRVTPALAFILLAVFLVAIALSASLLTANANARPTFAECSSCHSKEAVHARAGHTDCSKCHVNGAAPTPAACASCHTTGTIMAWPNHVANGCASTAGCHGVPSAAPTVVTTSVTLKVAPTTITLGKTVKASGVTTPAATLAGKKVALKVQRKAGTKWVAAKSATATVTSAGAYSWKYKPLKKGSYRVRASIAASSTYTASKTTYKTFKVK